ncbi:MAG TPA: hypothetical protein VJU87_08295 [Gemmatimonadaceae bacterium]|nr:hypothetical protein [Gemmatimonadaceae bacterium]
MRLTRFLARLSLVGVLPLAACELNTAPSLQGGGQEQLPAPLGLTSISLNHAVQLSWSDNVPQTGGSLFSYYRVYSATYDATSNTCDADYALEGSTVSDGFLAANLTNGASRCYWVSAVDVYGYESDWSTPRQDTPRYDARNVVVYASDVRPDSSGFLFYDGLTQRYGVVSSDGRTDLDFTIERHSDGTLWFNPARADVQMALYGSAPVTDLTSIDYAETSTLSSVTVEAAPGYAYIFGTVKSDGVHYAGVRVAYIAQDYVVLDWSYQSAIGNPELVRSANAGRMP